MNVQTRPLLEMTPQGGQLKTVYLGGAFLDFRSHEEHQNFKLMERNNKEILNRLTPTENKEVRWSLPTIFRKYTC